MVVFQSHSCRESELLMLLELSGPAVHGDHQQQIINHMVEIRLKKKPNSNALLTSCDTKSRSSLIATNPL